MSADRPAPRGWKGEALAALALVLVTLAVYARIGGHEFVTYDDGSYITENPHVRTGLSAENARWAFREFHSANWHPLTWLSHQLDCELFGLDPGPHHLENAFLHALNALLCLWAFRSMTGERWPSFLVALLFAVHPQRVESVAWASERKDVLAGTFFFATLLLYTSYARRPSLARYAALAAAFALGLLAKPMLVTLPFVLLLLDVWPLGRWGRASTLPATRIPSLAPTRIPSPAPTPPGDKTPPETRGGRGGFRILLEKIPLLALALISCWLTLRAQRAGGAVRSVEALPLAERLANLFQGYAAYVGKALWPVDLAFFYPHPALVSPDHSPVSWATLGAALLVLGVSALAIAGTRRAPWIAVGWFWFLGMLFPVIGLVQVGGQWIADRYAYLPLLGLQLALVFGLRHAFPAPRTQRILFAAGLAVSVGCAGLAARQTGTWKDSATLYEHALAVTDRNYVAHNNLGLLHQRAGELEQALAHYQAALAIAPRLVDAHSNLGAVYMELGERDLALQCFERALDLRPDYLDARLNRGLVFEREGDYDRALEHYESAVAAHPLAADAHSKVGDASTRLGEHERAIAAFRRALELEVDHVPARVGLGLALLEAGEREAALLELERALAQDPANPFALEGLAWILATSAEPRLRDPARAREVLDRVAPGSSATWRHKRVLAAVLAAHGEFELALRTILDAEAAAPSSEWDELRGERALYAAREALFLRP
jgi:tetratricopeptide (TPR) repeat protein